MKTIPKLILLLFLAISCTKSDLYSPYGSSFASEDAISTLATHYLGERFGGGIVFWLDSTGKHGMIADTTDLDVVAWDGRSSHALIPVPYLLIGTGKSNTKTIVSILGTTEKYAASVCSRSKRSGYKDWFLPSRNELNTLYLQKTIIGGFKEGYYWSSSTYGVDFAWSQDFASGKNFFNTNKSNVYNVRAVRYF